MVVGLLIVSASLTVWAGAVKRPSSNCTADRICVTLAGIVSLRWKFWLIMLLAVVTAVLAYPREDTILKALGLKKAALEVKQGLDLQGGAHLVFQADLSKTPENQRDQAMVSLNEVIERRANPSGTSEVSVQRQGSDRVIVQLPGVRDVQEAVDRIGKTANLTFYEIPPGGSVEQMQDTGIGG
jgi:preprotein translocase subunit SecD